MKLLAAAVFQVALGIELPDGALISGDEDSPSARYVSFEVPGWNQSAADQYVRNFQETGFVPCARLPGWHDFETVRYGERLSGLRIVHHLRKEATLSLLTIEIVLKGDGAASEIVLRRFENPRDLNATFSLLCPK